MTAPEQGTDLVERIKYFRRWMVAESEEPELHELLGMAIDELDRLRLAAPVGAKECWDRINALIVPGPLPGNGTDKTAQRNGLILAANAIFDLAHPTSLPSGEQGEGKNK